MKLRPAHRILYCRNCETEQPIVGTVPKICPECKQSARWSVSPWALLLTDEDRKLLRVNRISSS